MDSSFFVYLSTIEGILIVCMLGWEVYWLRRMYQALQSMPTSDQIGSMVKQIGEMVKAIREGKEMVDGSIGRVISLVLPFSSMFGGILGGKQQKQSDTLSDGKG